MSSALLAARLFACDSAGDRASPRPSLSTPPSTAWRPGFPRTGRSPCTRRTTGSSWRSFRRGISTARASRPASWHWRPRAWTSIAPGSTRAPRRTGARSGKLASNKLIKDGRGERLETVWEFHPDAGGFWREISVRIIANRQLYTFILNVEDSVYAKTRPAFDALLAATKFSPPNTGRRLAGEEHEPVDSARVPVCTRPSRRLAAGAGTERGRAALRQRACPRASGPTISWCWRIRIATTTWKSWRSSFPNSSSKRIRSARSSRARSSRRAGRRRLRPSCAPTEARSR